MSGFHSNIVLFSRFILGNVPRINDSYFRKILNLIFFPNSDQTYKSVTSPKTLLASNHNGQLPPGWLLPFSLIQHTNGVIGYFRMINGDIDLIKCADICCSISVSLLYSSSKRCSSCNSFSLAG